MEELHKGRGEEDEGGEGYFASVSDLMVGILFVFLLMLTVFALNFHDSDERFEQKEREAIADRHEAERQTALATEARTKAEHQSKLAKEAGIKAERKTALATEARAKATQLRLRNEALQAALAAAVARLQSEVRDREDARAELLNRLADGLKSRGVSFHIDQQSGVLRLSEDVPFSTGHSDLTDRTRHTVQMLAETLNQVLPCFTHNIVRTDCGPRDTPILEAVLVEGHTDHQAFTGMTPEQSLQENDRLSTERALNVFAELRRVQPGLESLHNGDDLPVLGVSGYGERRPLPETTGANAPDVAQNRRIDLRFVLAARTSDEVQRLINDIDRLRQGAE